MLKQNGYAQYQNSKIMTASPAELTLMLYEGAIKFGNIAIMAMENKDPAKAHENVVKVEKIIQNFPYLVAIYFFFHAILSAKFRNFFLNRNHMCIHSFCSILPAITVNSKSSGYFSCKCRQAFWSVRWNT